MKEHRPDTDGRLDAPLQAGDDYGKAVEILLGNPYTRGRKGHGLKPLGILIAALAASAATPSLGQGRLGLLPQGEYVCALPGSADGPAWVEVEGRGFSITGASSYRTRNGGGTYLLEGKRVTFTRGPMQGQRMMRVSSGMLQEVDRNGKLGRMRCHRAGPVAE